MTEATTSPPPLPRATKSGARGFFGVHGTLSRLVASWMMPAIMALAYGFMALTAENDSPNRSNTSRAWMALGFVFVLVVWWIFRYTTKTAALARAMLVGDSDTIFELYGASKSIAANVDRGFAYEMRGEWQSAIDAATAALATGKATADQRAQAAGVIVGALVEAGRGAEAREVYDRDLARGVRGHAAERIARLALARVACSEGKLDDAAAAVDKVLRDIRSGSAQRAIAHTYRARIADARGDAAAAAKDRAEAAKLAPVSWMRATA